MNQNYTNFDNPGTHVKTNVIPLSPRSSANGPVMFPLLLGPLNVITNCPCCNANVKTNVKHTVTTRTHITAALCTLICCCCCIPYCLDSAKNSDHYCPNCRRYIGTYEK